MKMNKREMYIIIVAAILFISILYFMSMETQSQKAALVVVTFGDCELTFDPPGGSGIQYYEPGTVVTMTSDKYTYWYEGPFVENCNFFYVGEGYSYNITVNEDTLLICSMNGVPR